MGLIVKRVTNSVSPDFLLPSNVENERRASFLQTFYSNRVSVTRYFTSLSLSLSSSVRDFLFLPSTIRVRSFPSLVFLTRREKFLKTKTKFNTRYRKRKKEKKRKMGQLEKWVCRVGRIRVRPLEHKELTRSPLPENVMYILIHLA